MHTQHFLNIYKGLKYMQPAGNFLNRNKDTASIGTGKKIERIKNNKMLCKGITGRKNYTYTIAIE